MGTIQIPDLESYAGSWIAIRKADGSVIGEFFNRDSLLVFNPATVEIKTISRHLADLNRTVR